MRCPSPNPRHRHTAFAGKRAPTPVRCQPTFPGESQMCVSRHFQARPKSASAEISQARRKTCRSRLAGECGVPAQTHGTDTPPSRASALLHRFCVSRNFRVNPKSASADISKSDPNLPPPTFPKPDAKPVGAGLLANAVSQPKPTAQTRRLRGQARSYTGSVSADISG